MRLAAESPGARLARAALFVALAGYTAFSAGPLAWAAALSVRSTSAILDAPYGFEWPPRFANYAEAWTVGGYQIYLANSLGITAVAGRFCWLLVGGTGELHADRAFTRFFRLRALLPSPVPGWLADLLPPPAGNDLRPVFQVHSDA